MPYRKTTIRDVAQKAGVSISVVSYVLNETKGKSISDETATRVREAAATLQYTPNRIAQSMRIGRSSMIAFVTFWRMSEYVTQQIMAGAYEYAQDAGYQMVIINPRAEDSTIYIDPYKRNQIDGILLLEPYRSLDHIFEEKPHLAAIQTYRIPAVFVNGQGGEQMKNFSIEVGPTTYLAARYFVEKGYRYIDYIAPNESEAGLPRTYARQRGYRQALSEFAFEGREYPSTALRQRLMEKPQGVPLALVVSKSNYIGEVLGSIREMGLQVPQDVAIVAGSYEPEYLVNHIPSISYMRVPTFETGRESCRYLISLVEGKPYEPQPIPMPEIHIRESG